MTDHEWFLDQIAKAESLERLLYLAEVISYDRDADEEYTREPGIVEIRRAWSERKQELS